MQTGFHREQEQDVACCGWVKVLVNARAKCLMQLPGPALLSTLETCAQTKLPRQQGQSCRRQAPYKSSRGYISNFDWQGSGWPSANAKEGLSSHELPSCSPVLACAEDVPGLLPGPTPLITGWVSAKEEGRAC